MTELVNQVRQSLMSIKHKKSLKEARGSSKAVSKPKPQRVATPKWTLKARGDITATTITTTKS